VFYFIVADPLFAHVILTDAVILHNATSDGSSHHVYCSYAGVIKVSYISIIRHF